MWITLPKHSRVGADPRGIHRGVSPLASLTKIRVITVKTGSACLRQTLALVNLPTKHGGGGFGATSSQPNYLLIPLWEGPYP